MSQINTSPYYVSKQLTFIIHILMQQWLQLHVYSGHINWYISLNQTQTRLLSLAIVVYHIATTQKIT